MSETILKMTGSISFGELECSSNKVPTFSMKAYTGSVVRVAGFDTPVIVDLKGITFAASGKIPIRMDHWKFYPVGHTTGIEVSDSMVSAKGVISRDNEWSRDIVASGKLGFPWQASIGGPILKTRLIEAGSTETVNGIVVEGPVTVVQKMKLKEISFVEHGADENTESVVEAIEIFNPGNTSLVISANEEERSVIMTNENRKADIAGLSEPASVVVDAKVADSSVVTTKVEAMQPVSQVSEYQADMPAKAASFSVRPSEQEIVSDYRSAIATERERIGMIESLGQGRHVELQNTAIREGWAPEKFELEFMRADRPVAPAAGSFQSKPQGKVFEALALSASGISTQRLEKMYDEQTLDATDKLRGIGLQEFCERACGMQLSRFNRDPYGWLQAAFSSVSLPGILSNVANKALLEGFNYVEDAWRSISKMGSTSNFLEHKRYRMTGAFTFEQVGPGGELKHGQVGEQEFTQQVNTHGIMFALTRQMIINDDIGLKAKMGVSEFSRNENIKDAITMNVTMSPMYVGPNPEDKPKWENWGEFVDGEFILKS